MALEKFIKQPADVQDYDFDFSAYLEARNDLATGHSVTADVGLNVDSSSLADGVVKAWVSGGEDANSYRLSVEITTQGGRTKTHDVLIKVKVP